MRCTGEQSLFSQLIPSAVGSNPVDIVAIRVSFGASIPDEYL
jgi:hypothetical protein